MTVLFYSGDLTRPNEGGGYLQAGELLSRYDYLVIDIPFPVAIDGMASVNDTVNTQLSVLSYMRKPVWIRLPMSRLWTTRAAFAAGLPVRLQSIMAILTKLGLADRVAGFMFEGFGFDSLFGDGTAVRRFDQNTAVQSTWVAPVALPAMVRAKFASDIDAVIGPVDRGDEPGAALDGPIFGTNPAFGDVLVGSDLFFSYAPTVASNYLPLQEFLALLRYRYDGFTRLATPIVTQSCDLSACAYDTLLGLTVDSTAGTLISSFVRAAKCIGFQQIGVNGKSSDDPNKVVPITLLTTTNVSDHAGATNGGDRFGTVESIGGDIYINNQVMTDGVLTAARWKFHADWSFNTRVF